MDHIYKVFKPERTFIKVWLRSSKFNEQVKMLM